MKLLTKSDIFLDFSGLLRISELYETERLGTNYSTVFTGIDASVHCT
jgi:hypothetical protein